MTDPGHAYHGFKTITAENWLRPDVPLLFPDFAPESWVEAHLTPRLNSSVPSEVAALFEAARGIMLYGWFFYPLITIAAEQSHRVVEAAARTRLRQLGIAPPRVSRKGRLLEPTFVEVIDALVRHGAISAADKGRWKATRDLRNWSSHPDFHRILSPGDALGILHSAATLINGLFP